MTFCLFTNSFVISPVTSVLRRTKASARVLSDTPATSAGSRKRVVAMGVSILLSIHRQLPTNKHNSTLRWPSHSGGGRQRGAKVSRSVRVQEAQGLLIRRRKSDRNPGAHRRGCRPLPPTCRKACQTSRWQLIQPTIRRRRPHKAYEEVCTH